MAQAYYRKWRPQGWEEVIGQDHVVRTLRNAVGQGNIAHAYLFSGPRGTGKTTTARIIAKAANCLDADHSRRPCNQCENCLSFNEGRFLDLIEIDAASNTSVEDVRDLRDKINFSPNQGRYKVYIIDEVHMLSTAAFNALLKTLEEPPSHAIFVLATTEVHKIPATVLSRCQRHEFRRIPVVDIVRQLKQMANEEGIQAEDAALSLIARQSTGAMRDAISLLDQLSSTGQIITLEMAQNVLGTAANQAVLDLLEALIAQKADVGLDVMHRALDAGSDPRQFARQVVDYLRDVLLIRMGNSDQIDATPETRAQMARHAQSFSTPDLLRVIRGFNFSAGEARASWQPALPLEMAFVEALEKPTAPVELPAPAAPSPKAARPMPTPKTPAVAPPAEPDVASSASLNAQDQQATQTLAESWPRMLSWVRKQDPKAYGLLNSVKSRQIRNDVLVLNYASDILKKQMEKPEYLEITRKALQHAFGRAIEVECRVDAVQRDSIPTGVDENGMVAAALRDLGGEIVDVQ
jgi:DNA polymerase-3 subunit gamma/tau